MSKKLFLSLLAALVVAGLVAVFKSNTIGSQTLWDVSRQGSWLLPLIAVSALVDSLNPCAFSILLVTIAFLLSLGRLRENILKIGSVYILGIFVVYLLIGLGLLQTLHLFNTPHFMAKVGAIILILVGFINLIGHYFPSFPIKLQIPSASHRKMAEFMEKGSVPASFALGVLVGLCEFPCTGGPYLLALGLLHDRATYLSGFFYLLLYNALFVLPLAITLLIASDGQVLARLDAWRKRNIGQMTLTSSIVMILLGLVIFYL